METNDHISSYLAGFHSRNEEVFELQNEIKRLNKELNYFKSANKKLNNYEHNESSKSNEENIKDFHSI